MSAEPENFSIDSARMCLDELVQLLPKGRRLEALSLMNELGVVMEQLFGFFVVALDDDAKAEARRLPVDKAMSAYLDRLKAQGVSA